MKYKIFTLLILIIFYSIFFIKMLIQKKTRNQNKTSRYHKRKENKNY